MLERPDLHADTCHIWVAALAHACADRLNLRRLEHSGAHTAQRLRWPANGPPVWLLPEGPELHPSERVWRDVKAALAGLQFPERDAPQVSGGELLQAGEASPLQALTGDAYAREAIHALG